PTGEDIDGAAEPMIDRLSRRLEHVEIENRRLRRALVGIVGLCGLFAAGAVLLAELTPRILRADQIVLRNSKGQTAVLLRTGKNDMPDLSFFDPEQRVRMLLGIGSNGAPLLGFYDTTKKLRQL